MKCLFFLMVLFPVFLCAFHEHYMVVIIPSRNNVTVCKKNLESVFAQTYTNYHIIYIDDASDDGTYEEVCNYITECNQWHRVTLIRNGKRHGQMYNHFMATHMCSNDTIIINLDGDDTLSPDALEIINRAYQNPNVWMTYGQYREEPYGKLGHCRRIPTPVLKGNAYRYYDWITSHLRTFYAGLFKQIPIGHFIHEDIFQPSAVDHAMMFAMLELSAGRVKFIDMVIYHYNVANPENIFKKNVIQQLKMAHMSRARKPLEPLTFDPRASDVGDTSHARVALIVVSEDPEQLQYFLSMYETSNIACDDIHIIYSPTDQSMQQRYETIFKIYSHLISHTMSVTQMKNGILSVCKNSHCSHVLLLSDANVIHSTFDCKRCIALLEKTHARGFYLYLDPTITRCASYAACDMRLPVIELESDVLVWKFKHAQGPWRVIYSPDGALYRMQELHNVISECDFNTIDELRYALTLRNTTDEEDVGLCFMTSSIA